MQKITPYGLTSYVQQKGTCSKGAPKQNRIPPHFEWDELSSRIINKELGLTKKMIGLMSESELRQIQTYLLCQIADKNMNTDDENGTESVQHNVDWNNCIAPSIKMATKRCLGCHQFFQVEDALLEKCVCPYCYFKLATRLAKKRKSTK